MNPEDMDPNTAVIEPGELFSVYQFFLGGMYEQVRENVPLDEAHKAFMHYTTCVAVRMGLTQRVIITDESDYVCAEWRAGHGIVWPNDTHTPPSDVELTHQARAEHGHDCEG